MHILADLDEAERCASEHATPRGQLRVNANVPFGHHFLLPLVPEFLECYPEVQLDIMLTDKVVDILEERTDVAVRAGQLKSSNLMARKLGQTRMMIVGSANYLERNGTPSTPEDLQQHNRLGANYLRAQSGWPLRYGSEDLVVPISGNVQVSDGEALHRLVLAGLGLARLATFQVRKDIDAGRLQPVLEKYNPGDIEEVHAVYVGQGGYMPLRVRAFLDFLAERVDINSG
ncbi:LysR substrate-binding domain-containing protein [Yersinia sp. 2544 StPb PI]|uniref:LysR substrate-binding domain-containing protein n=1 Tax=Yersinia sp. 2544 StPb PI TaxID=3117409 RepID=UPI003B27CE5F